MLMIALVRTQRPTIEASETGSVNSARSAVTESLWATRKQPQAQALTLVLDDVDGAGVGARDRAGVAEDQLEHATGVALAVEGEADVDELVGDAALQDALGGADALLDGPLQHGRRGRQGEGVDAVRGQAGERGAEALAGADQDEHVEFLGRGAAGLGDGQAGAITEEEGGPCGAAGLAEELQTTEGRVAPDLTTQPGHDLGEAGDHPGGFHPASLAAAASACTRFRGR